MTGTANEVRDSVFAKFRRMLGRLRRSFVFDTFDVFAKAVLPEHGKFNNPAGYRFSFASGDEIARCVESHTELNDRERREGAARVAMGHACVIAYPTEPGNAPAVFTMWVNPRNINIPGHIKRKLKPHQAFIYKAFTSPEHRGRKIYESGMRFVLAELARQGKSQLLGYAHIKKAVSRKGLAALQFDTIGTFRTFGIGRWCVTATSSRLRRELPEVLKSSGLPADHLYADAQTRVSRN